MASKGIQWLTVATLGASIVAGTVAVTQAPTPLPPCLAEDGGPIPCVWDPQLQGTFHPGDPTTKVTITRAP